MIFRGTDRLLSAVKRPVSAGLLRYSHGLSFSVTLCAKPQRGSALTAAWPRPGAQRPSSMSMAAPGSGRAGEVTAAPGSSSMACGGWVLRGCRARGWIQERLTPARSSEHRFTIVTQQRHGFRKAPKKIEPRKPEPEKAPETFKSGISPPIQKTVVHTTSNTLKHLFKPFVFTVGFTGCAFVSASIWQYEALKFRVQSYFDELRTDWMDKMRPQKEMDFRKQVNKWWNGLSEGQRTVTGIIAANICVFCLWKVPSMQRTMLRYFTSNPASRTLCLPMVLSTFSHFSLFHMAANMYVLWSFSSSIVSILGPEQFVAVYFSAGVISSFASYVCKMATGRFGPSLGASGAIMTVLAAVCTKMPEAKLAIILLPMFTFTAGTALKAIIALDTAGLVLGWRLFDHAAHLGGALFGIWYVTYGHELIWKNREPLVKIWHEWRTKTPGKGGSS